MADLKTDAKYIGELGDYLKFDLHPTIGWFALQMYSSGCAKDGFTGLLTPLQFAMDELANLAQQAGNLMASKMASTYQGLYATANSYAGLEKNNTMNLTASGRR